MKPKKYVLSLSGGKDSTAMLLRLLEEKRPVDLILFCDTGLEFPQMYEHGVDVSRETSTLFCVLVSPFHVKHFSQVFSHFADFLLKPTENVIY